MRTNPILILSIYFQQSTHSTNLHTVFFQSLQFPFFVQDFIHDMWSVNVYPIFFYYKVCAVCFAQWGTTKFLFFFSQFLCILNVSYLKFCHSANQMNNYYHPSVLHFQLPNQSIIYCVPNTFPKEYIHKLDIFLLINMLTFQTRRQIYK